MMKLQRFSILVSNFLILSLIILPIQIFGGDFNQIDDKKSFVTMRVIGHKLLTAFGDSTSRVLPVQKVEETQMSISYKISFETEFGFEPGNIASILVPIMEDANLASHYIVETKQCESNDVVHSFEIGRQVPESSFGVCSGRVLPDDCYYIIITMYRQGSTFVHAIPGDQENLNAQLSAQDVTDNSQTKKASPIPSVLFLIPILFIIGLTGYFIKFKQPEGNDPDLMDIGNTKFNVRKRELSINNQRSELSQKESELLTILFTSANQPVEREVLLNKVWGDEGDYVGRTLDVFISKLRKKLEPDASIKIENIRGVGYRLVLI